MSPVSDADVSRMFGYVSPEDQARWQQARAKKDGDLGFFRSFIKGGAESMMEFRQQTLQARLHAAHKVDEQAKFDESHQRRISAGPQDITESVEYTPTELREDVTDEMEF